MIAFAAMLWGTDGIFRTSLIETMPNPVAIVAWEHVLLVASTGWLIWRFRGQLARLNAGDWVAVAIVAVGASALATVLFTFAFGFASPTTVLLLQKTQPLWAISLAALLLREPLPDRFWPLVPFALVGAYFITFGDPAFGGDGRTLVNPFAALGGSNDKLLGVAMTLVAAAFWGAGTVLGRRVLGKIEFPTMTALRFAGALPSLLVVLAVEPSLFGPSPVTAFQVPGPAQVAPLIGTVFFSGLLGILLYYRGLRDTPAAVSTLCELCFPIAAIVLNVVVLGTPVGPWQVAGVILLWGALALMRHHPAPAADLVAAAAPA
jgi:drug/metabolite transporter (DMT)-like permease